MQVGDRGCAYHDVVVVVREVERVDHLVRMGARLVSEPGGTQRGPLSGPGESCFYCKCLSSEAQVPYGIREVCHRASSLDKFIFGALYVLGSTRHEHIHVYVREHVRVR